MFYRVASVLVLTCAIGATLHAGATMAETARGQVAAGRALARSQCATCHVVEPSGKAGLTDAPSFVTIARKRGVTAAEFSAYIRKPHMNMLNDQRPAEEADALAAYIVSLRGR